MLLYLVANTLHFRLIEVRPYRLFVHLSLSRDSAERGKVTKGPAIKPTGSNYAPSQFKMQNKSRYVRALSVNLIPND